MINVYSTTGSSEQVLEAMFLGLLFVFGVMLFDFFVLKLPPMLVEEKWPQGPPASLRFAWLPASMVESYNIPGNE